MHALSDSEYFAELDFEKDRQKFWNAIDNLVGPPLSNAFSAIFAYAHQEGLHEVDVIVNALDLKEENVLAGLDKRSEYFQYIYENYGPELVW